MKGIKCSKTTREFIFNWLNKYDEIELKYFPEICQDMGIYGIKQIIKIPHNNKIKIVTIENEIFILELFHDNPDESSMISYMDNEVEKQYELNCFGKMELKFIIVKSKEITVKAYLHCEEVTSYRVYNRLANKDEELGVFIETWEEYEIDLEKKVSVAKRLLNFPFIFSKSNVDRLLEEIGYKNKIKYFFVEKTLMLNDKIVTESRFDVKKEKNKFIMNYSKRIGNEMFICREVHDEWKYINYDLKLEIEIKKFTDPSSGNISVSCEKQNINQFFEIMNSNYFEELKLKILKIKELMEE